MNLFESLTLEALKNQEKLASLRIVVEKELLHHDILRIMAGKSFLSDLTFIGGTCLRDCYGSPRLSEDLDFTGGRNFNRALLHELGPTLEAALGDKYSLPVIVSEPQREEGNVDTWKIRLVTRPERPDLSAQKINIDICAIHSHKRQPTTIRNNYDVDMGTFGLIVQAESLEEILADKYIALAMRPNRVKQRDIWDLYWLDLQGIAIDLSLLKVKLEDRHIEIADFKTALSGRMEGLASGYSEFKKEIVRFLPLTITRGLDQNGYWEALTDGLKYQSTLILGGLPA